MTSWKPVVNDRLKMLKTLATTVFKTNQKIPCEILLPSNKELYAWDTRPSGLWHDGGWWGEEQAHLKLARLPDANILTGYCQTQKYKNNFRVCKFQSNHSTLIQSSFMFYTLWFLKSWIMFLPQQPTNLYHKSFYKGSAGTYQSEAPYKTQPYK